MAFENTDERISLDQDNPLDQVVIPLLAEEISVGKKKVTTGRVKVSTVTHSREEQIEQLLASDRVEVERVPMGQVVPRIPEVRTEGDITIIPVVEETIVLQRQLVLKEEVRVRRIHETQNYRESVVLRQQEAVITRVPEDTNPDVAVAAPAKDK